MLQKEVEDVANLEVCLFTRAAPAVCGGLLLRRQKCRPVGLPVIVRLSRW